MRRKLALLAAILLTAACGTGDAMIELAAQSPGADLGLPPPPSVEPVDRTAPEDQEHQPDRWPEPVPLPPATPEQFEPQPIEPAVAGAALALAPDRLRPVEPVPHDDTKLVFESPGGGTVTVFGQALAKGDRHESERYMSVFGQRIEAADGTSIWLERTDGDVGGSIVVLVGQFQFTVATTAAWPGEPVPLSLVELERYALAIAAKLR